MSMLIWKSQLTPPLMGWELFYCRKMAILGSQSCMPHVPWQQLNAAMLKWRRRLWLQVVMRKIFKLHPRQEICYKKWPQATNSLIGQQKPPQPTSKNHAFLSTAGSLRLRNFSCPRKTPCHSGHSITCPSTITGHSHISARRGWIPHGGMYCHPSS